MNSCAFFQFLGLLSVNLKKLLVHSLEVFYYFVFYLLSMGRFFSLIHFELLKSQRSN